MKTPNPEPRTPRPASNIIKTLLIIGIFLIAGFPVSSPAGSDYQYQLYKNPENFGIVVFPKKNIFAELDEYIQSIGFESAESGDAVMRSGTKGENQTYMMPLGVQEKHSIKMFIVLQALAEERLLVGVYHPEWGLTLPSQIFGLDEVKKNIPKTLSVFRKDNPQRQTLRQTPGNPVQTVGSHYNRLQTENSRYAFSPPQVMGMSRF